MATASVSTNANNATRSVRAGDVVRAILTPLASLKFTVFLLILGVLITFISTLEQTRADSYTVKSRHVRLFEGDMRHAFVEIPMQTFFVPSFIPSWAPKLDNVPGSIFIPSGGLLLVLMLINLSAAHALRFKLHARGMKLVIGLAVAAFAGFLTWAIIFNGENSEGFQAQPLVSWDVLWRLLQFAVLGIIVSSAVAIYRLESNRKLEKWLLGMAAVVFIVVLGVTLFMGKDKFIGDSAMRILWQLSQSTIAALVSFLACWILFKRKAGIVLLHLGIAGLLFNEIYVTQTNQEFRMTVLEGETVSLALDLRATEMAIINTSDPEFDEIVTIPGHRLRSDTSISNDQLPFDVTCIKYLPSSDLRKSTGNSLATVGIGKLADVVSTTSATGTGSEQAVDFASAFVEITNKSNGESLGIHLISQNLNIASSDAIEVDGMSYRILLQFETEYKPYSVFLKDAKRENYVGTQTASSYSSDIVLTDFETGKKTNQLIWMNNPLRYSGETFYQSDMRADPNGVEYSVFQVVRNHGWMIPYVCCMFTVVGLMAQFGNSLIGYLKKQATALVRKPNALPGEPIMAPVVSIRAWRGWLPTAILTGGSAAICGVMVLMALGGKPEKEGMRLDLLRQLPVTINGRVQPLDSLARNTARQLKKRESVVDGNGKKQPAIRWIADTLFEADGYQDYRLFRIENKTVIGALELPLVFKNDPDRKKFVYSLSEIRKAEENLRRLLPKNDDDSRSEFEERLIKIATKLQMVEVIQFEFGASPENQPVDTLTRLRMASRTVTSPLISPLIPLVISTQDPETPWISMLVAETRIWLYELSQTYEVDTTKTLARAIIAQEIIPQLREDAIRDRVIQKIVSNPEFLKLMGTDLSESNPLALARLMKEKWNEIPESFKAGLIRAEAPLVDALIAQRMPEFEAELEDQLIAVNGSEGKIKSVDADAIDPLLAIQAAYLDNDSETFNATLESYLTHIKSDAPIGLTPHKLNTEVLYNGISPFFIAMILYLVAFVVAGFGWIGWSTPLNRASTGLLMLGLLFHIMGVVLRIDISGRPPVTNLYSSVLFVSAAGVVLLIVVELMTKLGIGNALAGIAGFGALMWAWSMTIIDGDTFTVMVAVLDTQFWLATHVVIISLGYAATFAGGLLGAAYLIASLITPAMEAKDIRRSFNNVIYGLICFGLFFSFFGTVLGGLWGDDAWGRFWGWDPKENGALMIVLWNAVILHARWSGLARERGIAALAALGNVVVLWSWKGVNAMGVGLHAYAGTGEDKTILYVLCIAGFHVFLAMMVLIPVRFWMSYATEESAKLKKLA